MASAANNEPLVIELVRLLAQPVPRSIPDEFSDGFFVKSCKSKILWTAVGGTCLLAIAGLVWIRVIPASLFFLFGVGISVGILLLATAVWDAFCLYVLRRPFAKFRDGKVVDAVIEEICLAPTQFNNGLASAFAFCAKCSVVDPVAESVPKTFHCQSKTLSVEEKDLYTTTFKVGEIAPAIYKPNGGEKAIQLFGFLGLQPGYGIVRKLREKEPFRPWHIALGVLVMGIPIASMFLAPVILDRYNPIVPNTLGLIVEVVGALLIGGGFFGYLRHQLNRIENAGSKENEAAVASGEVIQFIPKRRKRLDLILFAAALMLGWCTVSVWAYGLNAAIDFSKPVNQPVEIVSVNEPKETVTFSFLPNANRGNDEFLSHVPLHRIQLLKDKGVAEVKAGAFGWDWVRAIHPAAEDALDK